MRLKCDFHLHTALSPCAEDDMTPGNVVAMAYLNGLDVIAITDHQSAKNVRSALAASEKIASEEGKRILVLPGMEIECQEGFHMIALFPDETIAEEFEKHLEASRVQIENRPDVFGRQIIFNEEDEESGTVNQLLLTASERNSNDLANEVLELGGVIFPAHIDRDSYSILMSLGSIPPEFPAKVFELSMNCQVDRFFSQHSELLHSHYFVDSDAHRLTDIGTGWLMDFPQITMETFDARHMIEALREKIIK